MKKFLSLLLRNNTGVSLKAFTALSGVISSSFLVLCIVIVLIVDLFSSYKIETDLYGIAAVLGAIAGYTMAAIWGKVKGDQNEINNNQNNEGNIQ